MHVYIFFRFHKAGTEGVMRCWRLHPSISQFVTSLCPRYANRPIRATDDKGTCTPQVLQPCRLLPIPSTLRLTAYLLAVLRLKLYVTIQPPRTCYPGLACLPGRVSPPLDYTTLPGRTINQSPFSRRRLARSS